MRIEYNLEGNSQINIYHINVGDLVVLRHDLVIYDDSERESIWYVVEEQDKYSLRRFSSSEWETYNGRYNSMMELLKPLEDKILTVYPKYEYKFNLERMRNNMTLAKELLSITKCVNRYSYEEIETLLREVASKGERDVYLYDKCLPYDVKEKLRNGGISILDKSDEGDGYYYYISF